MLSIAPLFLAALFYAPPLPFEPLTEGDVLEAPTRHIRTTDHTVRRLMRRGYRESATFAALVRTLQRSDVIVYIEDVPRLPGALEGRMMMLPRAHGHRYVRIQIAMRGAPEDAIAVLGHELQHAVEVAEAVEVSDTDALARLYQRIGTRSGPHIYDTIAAQETGRNVRRELSLA
jgi:hypothetical protein